jgi:hypothetical protein
MPIVESNVLTEDVIQMLATETHEVIQTFPLEQTDPRFGKCIRIRRLSRGSIQSGSKM